MKYLLSQQQNTYTQLTITIVHVVQKGVGKYVTGRRMRFQPIKYIYS